MRREETHVERAGSDDQLSGDDRDRPPSLRIGGYVSGTAEPADEEADQQVDGVKLPNIADYWPDAPHRRRTGQAETDQPPAWQILLPSSANPTLPRPRRNGSEPATEPAEPRLRRSAILAGIVALLIAGGTILLIRANSEPDTRRPGTGQNAALPQTPQIPASEAPPEPTATAPSPTPASPSPKPSPSPTTTTVPPRPRLPERARFELADGVTELSVRTAELDGEAFQVSTPADSGLDVDTRFGNGVLRVDTDNDGSGSGRLNVLLNEDVVWHVQMNAGARLADIDMGTGTVNRIDLDGGAERINVSVGRLATTLPIRMTGGVNRWRIETAREVPVRVEVSNGAGNVVLYGDESGGVGKGETVRSGDLGDRPGLDIDAAAGLGSLEVTED
ncbi:hypothetical protein [Actinoplanes sp. GCM10030250]|uniref:hypothetical protein n=1 Tax=Actinoplanes sp. GCM10030250 TaxID=3273376 RepID=UPI0036100B7C